MQSNYYYGKSVVETVFGCECTIWSAYMSDYPMVTNTITCVMINHVRVSDMATII